MPVRIERTGNVDALTPQLVSFIKEALGGTSLDDIQHPSETRIDFSCLNGLVAIEMKSLTEDGSERLAHLTEELQSREDWPSFFGSWPITSVIKNLKDKDAIIRRVTERIGRSIINHIKKADDQLAAHVRSFPRKNLLRIVLLINEDHEIYEPQVVTQTIARILWRIENDEPRYKNIDAVIFVTERHATILNGQIIFPFVVVTGKPVIDTPWKNLVIDFIMRRWSTWSGRAVYEHQKNKIFATIDHVPDRMPRRDLWALNYRRNPYLQDCTDNDIRDRWDDIHILALVAFHKEAPIRIPMDAIHRNSELHTHLLEEVAKRGLPNGFFRPTKSRMTEAAKRIGFAPEVQSWIAITLDGLQER